MPPPSHVHGWEQVYGFKQCIHTLGVFKYRNPSFDIMDRRTAVIANRTYRKSAAHLRSFALRQTNLLEPPLCLLPRLYLYQIHILQPVVLLVVIAQCMFRNSAVGRQLVGYVIFLAVLCAHSRSGLTPVSFIPRQANLLWPPLCILLSTLYLCQLVSHNRLHCSGPIHGSVCSGLWQQGNMICQPRVLIS